MSQSQYMINQYLDANKVCLVLLLTYNEIYEKVSPIPQAKIVWTQDESIKSILSHIGYVNIQDKLNPVSYF